MGDEEVHGMKAGGELGYSIVVGPALEWGMRVVRYGRGRCWRGQEVMWKAVDARCVVGGLIRAGVVVVVYRVLVHVHAVVLTLVIRLTAVDVGRRCIRSRGSCHGAGHHVGGGRVRHVIAIRDMNFGIASRVLDIRRC